MKKIALFFLYVILFFAALLFFTPKENLYYFGEEQLKPLGVVIADEEVIDHGFSLSLKGATIYFKKIRSADIGSINAKIFALYNNLHVENIVLDPAVEQFFPPEITYVNVTHSIFSPLQVHADAEGDFGSATAQVNLADRNGTVIVTPSKIMTSRFRNTLRQLKKSKGGDYYYEFKF